MRRLREAGHEAILAGGCVRDLLLGAKPKDYDVATNATPEQVAALFDDTQPVGARFGVVLVIVEHMAFDVATFRSEDTYSDGRRPDHVEYCGIEQDARRRDFTINAMYWDPVEDRLLDPVGGRKDLAEGVLRAVGDPASRFREDHLRILRAVRFAARFDFRMDPDTARALSTLAPLVEGVSGERIQQELRAILTDRDPARALRMMDEMGLLFVVFPELAEAKGCEQPKNYHPEGDVFVHTILTVEKLGAYPEFVLAMAALLHDVGKPAAARNGAEGCAFPEHERLGREMAGDICRRLRVSREETDRICWLVHRHMYFRHARQMKDSTLKSLFSEPGFDQLCALVRADALASWGNLADVEYVLERRRDMPPEQVAPPALITGHDLIDRGYEPGPAFRLILNEVREQQLNGEIVDKQDALAVAERTARDLNAPRRPKAGQGDEPSPES